MADTIKGITLKLFGDTSDLSASFRKVEHDIEGTQSALKAVDKALKLDPENVELVAQKQRLLTSAVEETEKKLLTLKSAASQAMSTLGQEGGATENDIAKLQAAIVQTESKLKGYEAQLADVSGKTEDLGNETDEAGDNIAEAGDKAEKSGVNWEKFGDAAKKAAEVALAATAALAAAITAAAKALTDCTVEAAAFADEVLTQSAVTGIATDELQAYMYAAELVDVSTETLTGSMARNIRTMTSAADGTGAAAEAYAALGVEVTNSDGTLRDSQTVYWELIDALGQVEDETERDSLAMTILGKSAQDLNPLIEAGSDRMQELATQAEDAGYIMSGDTLEAFHEFDDQLQYLEVGATAAKNALGTILLPILTDLAGEGVSLLSEFTNKVNEADGDIGQISGIIGEMLPQVLGVISSYLPMILEMAGTVLMSILDGLLTNADQILTTAASILETLAMGLLQALPSLVPTVISVLMGIVDFAVDNIDLILEISFQIFEALISGITSNLPTLIPAVISIINSITEFALSHIDEIIVMAIQLILGLATGFIAAIPDILASIPTIISSILDALGDLGPELVDMALTWGSDLIDNFISGITGAAGRLWDSLTGIAQGIKDMIGFSVPKRGVLHEWATHNPGADMVDLWSEGVDSNLGTLQTSMTAFGNVVADGGTVDYSGQLNAINTSLGNIGGAKFVVPVYVGGRLLDTYITEAETNNNFRGGGR